MTFTDFLDAGPLGLVTNPQASALSLACAAWLQSQLACKNQVIIPEVADYEVRRELLRAKNAAGLARFDTLAAKLPFLPITIVAMRKAAEFWAMARQQGFPTAPDQSLDADVILAAQATTLVPSNFVIATTNVAHLSRFAPAALWSNIKPNL